jgi:hypothetical protein
MWGNRASANLNCVFELQFEHGMSDSSVGLEIWAPREYSITFRGGIVKVVTDGNVIKEEEVRSYTGRRIKVNLIANEERLFVAIENATIVDERNVYWKGKFLKPRLNTDIGDTIILYGAWCPAK